MTYILYFDYAAIGILCFVLFILLTRKQMEKPVSRLYLVLTLMSIVALVSDIAAIVCQSDMERYGKGICYFWNYLYLFTHSQMSFVLVLYVLVLLGQIRRVKKWQWAILCLPSLAMFLLLALNPFFGWYFYYNEENLYTYGPLSGLLIGCSSLYILIALILVLVFRRTMNQNMALALFVFFFLMLASVVFQRFHPELLVGLYAQSLGLLGILIALENKDEIRALVAAREAAELQRRRAGEINRSKNAFVEQTAGELLKPLQAMLEKNEQILQEAVLAQDEKQDASLLQHRMKDIGTHAGSIKATGVELRKQLEHLKEYAKEEGGALPELSAEEMMPSMSSEEAKRRLQKEAEQFLKDYRALKKPQSAAIL